MSSNMQPLTYLVWRTVVEAGELTGNDLAEQLSYLSETRLRNALYNLRGAAFLVSEPVAGQSTRLFKPGPNVPRNLDVLKRELEAHPVYLRAAPDVSPRESRAATPKKKPAEAGEIVQPARPNLTLPWDRPYMAAPVRPGSLDFTRCGSVRAGGRLVHCYSAIADTTKEAGRT